MAQKRSEKIYQIITLEELCGALFGAEDGEKCLIHPVLHQTCLLYTSDAADD